MEPTIYLSISIYYLITTYFYLLYFCYFCLIPSTNKISYFKAKCLEKKEKIVVGKVRVAKAVGIIILYIGRIRFVILEKGKRITERKEIN